MSKLHFPSCLQHPEVTQKAFVLQFLEFFALENMVNVNYGCVRVQRREREACGLELAGSGELSEA